MPTAELTAREAQLLDTTLEVLHEHGYDGFTVDEVAARARASKATVYRRWPSKAELVVAAFTHGVREAAQVPDQGDLRSDLLALGTVVLAQLRANGAAITGLISEIHRRPELRRVFEEEFFEDRRRVVLSVLQRAVDRGELGTGALDEELWDILPGYLVYRSMTPGRPPDESTVQRLVDDVVLPALLRTRA